MSTPYTAPPTVPRQRRRGGVVWPLLLIFIGGVFLLENTGYLPPNFWTNLWRLWPVVLVLIGIELLFGNRVPWLLLACVAACVLIVGAVAANHTWGAQSSAAPPVTRTLETDLDGATQATVTVRYGAGELNIGPLDQPRATQIAAMTYDGPPELAPEPRYRKIGNGAGQLEYQSSGRSGPSFPWGAPQADGSARLDLNFAPGVPIPSFTVQTGAANAHLDFSKLKVNSIDLSIGAATAWIRFPEAAGATSAHISGGASTITLEIPQGVSARIQQRGGLNTFNIDQNRFPQESSGVYRSPDFDTAQNKLDVTLETGVATIQVN